MAELNKEQIAAGAQWEQLRDRMFETLDSNASGAITKDELKYSSLADQLLEKWETINADHDGKITLEEWNAFFAAVMASHEWTVAEMTDFCAGLVYEADINVDDLVVAGAPAEDGAGPARSALALLGQAYTMAKTKIGVPEAAAAKLAEIESVVAGNLVPNQLVDAVDGRISIVRNETTRRVTLIKDTATKRADSLKAQIKDSATKRVGSIKDAAIKRVDSISQRPVVKNLISPVTAAVVGGILEASDVVIDYALPQPEAEAAAETKAAEEEAAAAPIEEVPEKAKSIAKKLHSRLRTRAVSGYEALQQRREELVQVDLIAYAKGFLGNVKPQWLGSESAVSRPDLKGMQKFAAAVLEPYRQQLKGQWDAKAQPVIIAVTNYGEYFMEHVHEYEQSGEPKVAEKPEQENAVNEFIARVAHRFVEPSLVRTVAVFMVLGDEMRRLKVQAIEPSLKGIKTKAYTKVNEAMASMPTVAWATEKAQAVVGNATDTLYAQYTAGLKRLDGRRVQFDEFRSKVAGAVGTEFERLVSPVQAKILEGTQALDWEGKKVTLEAYRAKVVEAFGGEWEKHSATVAPLVQQIHAYIHATKDWVTSKLSAEEEEAPAKPAINAVLVDTPAAPEESKAAC